MCATTTFCHNPFCTICVNFLLCNVNVNTANTNSTLKDDQRQQSSLDASGAGKKELEAGGMKSQETNVKLRHGAKRRNHKLLTCFGSKQAGSQQSLTKIDSQNSSSSSPSSPSSSGAISAQHSPKQLKSGSSKEGKRRPSQLVPQNYYAEPEPPLLLNLEPTTYGKRLASSAVQTDERATNANKLSTCARPPRRIRCLCTRRQKSQMTIDIEDPTLSTGPIVSAPEKQLKDASTSITVQLDAADKEVEAPLVESPEERLIESYSNLGGKMRTCPIQTDSDSVTVNYVTIAQQPLGEVLEAEKVGDDKKDAGTGIGDDGYVSGSGGSLNKADSKRLSKEREKRERRQAKEAKKRAKEDDAKADKLRRKEDKVKKKAEKKKSSKDDEKTSSSPRETAELESEKIPSDPKATDEINERSVSVAEKPRVEIREPQDAATNVESKSAVHEEVKSKPHSSDEASKVEMLNTIANELVTEAIRASCEHLESLSTDDKTTETKAEKKKKKAEERRLAKEKAKIEKMQKEEEGKAKKKQEGEARKKAAKEAKKSKRTGKESSSESSEAEATTNSQSRSFLDRLLGRQTKPKVTKQRKEVSDESKAGKPAESKHQIVISEMYPKDPNDANGEMILEVNMPKSLIEDQLKSEHSATVSPVELTADEAQAQVTTTNIEDHGQSSMIESLPTSEHLEDTLVNISQLPTLSEANPAEEEKKSRDKREISQDQTDEDDPATENQFAQNEIDDSIAISDHQAAEAEEPKDGQEAKAAKNTELNDENKRKELETKLKREAEKQAKEEKEARKREEKERAKKMKLEKKAAEKEKAKQAKEEKARLKREAKEAKQREKLDKLEKKKKKKEDSKGELAGSSSQTAEVDTKVKLLGEDPNHAGMVPVSEEKETEKFVEEIVGDDGIVTKITKTVETKSVTLRGEEVQVKSRDLDPDEYERLKSLGQLDTIYDEPAPTSSSEPPKVERQLPAELIEICSTPSCFESIAECEKLQDPSLSEKKRAQVMKKEIAKRIKLNEKLTKRALKLAKSQSKVARHKAQQAEAEIKTSSEAAEKASNEVKKARKEAKKAEKMVQKAHKKMDQVDKKLAKQQKKIDKKQEKLDKEAAKLSRKVEKKREEQAKKNAKLEKKAQKKADKEASLDRKGSQKSKKSIKLEDIGEPKLRSSSRLSLGGSQGIAIVATSAGLMQEGQPDGLSEVRQGQELKSGESTSVDDMQIEMSLDDSHIRQADAELDELGQDEILDEPVRVTPRQATQVAQEPVMDALDSVPLDVTPKKVLDPIEYVHESQVEPQVVHKLEAIQEEQSSPTAQGFKDVEQSEESSTLPESVDRVQSPVLSSPPPESSIVTSNESFSQDLEPEIIAASSDPQYVQFQSGPSPSESPIRQIESSPTRSPDLMQSGSDINAANAQAFGFDSPDSQVPIQHDYIEPSSQYDGYNIEPHESSIDNQDNLVSFSPSPQPLDSFESSTASPDLQENVASEENRVDIEPARSPDSLSDKTVGSNHGDQVGSYEHSNDQSRTSPEGDKLISFEDQSDRGQQSSPISGESLD